MSLTLQVVVPIMAAIAAGITGGLIGLLSARRQNLINEIRKGFRDLELIRVAPSKVRWRSYNPPPIPKIVTCPAEPGDDEWMEAILSLKSLASVLMDDKLYGILCSVENDMEGFVRAARSFTIDDGTRHGNRERCVGQLNEHVPEAERRLQDWLGVRRWLGATLGFRRRMVERRPFVRG